LSYLKFSASPLSNHSGSTVAGIAWEYLRTNSSGACCQPDDCGEPYLLGSTPSPLVEDPESSNATLHRSG
jgi:hypothetical protein